MNMKARAAPLAMPVNSLLTVEDVAELLKVPLSWVYEHTRNRGVDRIPGFRLGKYWRFREADVLAWIERQKVGVRSNA
jgi:excisionase family DNA binding protein